MPRNITAKVKGTRFGRSESVRAAVRSRGKFIGATEVTVRERCLIGELEHTVRANPSKVPGIVHAASHRMKTSLRPCDWVICGKHH